MKIQYDLNIKPCKRLTASVSTHACTFYFYTTINDNEVKLLTACVPTEVGTCIQAINEPLDSRNMFLPQTLYWLCVCVLLVLSMISSRQRWGIIEIRVIGEILKELSGRNNCLSRALLHHQ